MTRPGLTVRDSQILDLLLAGVPKSHITERGLYQRAWNAADVERVAARQVIPKQEAGRWTVPTLRDKTRTVTIPPRLADILAGCCEGLTNKQIGTRLFITEDTVKTHMRRLLRALEANDRAHAVALACSGQVDVVISGYTKRACSQPVDETVHSDTEIVDGLGVA